MAIVLFKDTNKIVKDKRVINAICRRAMTYAEKTHDVKTRYFEGCFKPYVVEM